MVVVFLLVRFSEFPQPAPADSFVPDPECYSQQSASDYRGSVSVTKSGKTCQAWNAQSPHRHLFKEATHASSGIGSHNYCRNPDGDGEIM